MIVNRRDIPNGRVRRKANVLYKTDKIISLHIVGSVSTQEGGKEEVLVWTLLA